MIKIKVLGIATVAMMLNGCVSVTGVTKEAGEITLYDGSQAGLLKECKRLGKVTGHGSGMKIRVFNDGWSGVREDAKNDLRVNAKKKYGADSVVLISFDKGAFSGITAHGIAYKCH
ncbi:MAG: DUF4156 domain-containing protein [Campylobacterota bacterium]|nr:DUF4156 domain-containing protein [Campylobacterota bacterium]